MKDYGAERDEKRERAAHAVRRLVREFGSHPWDINNGECEEFADALADALGDDNDEAVVVDCASDDWSIDYHHQCVRYGDRYYDAEEPYGVTDWRHLPLVIRHDRRDP
ncbi:MAG TPA: hypothetical protein VFO62_00430 [Candidatus Binatia bacterium]|nr:hypothetical protein [Candidatus Binatia bacterium]